MKAGQVSVIPGGWFSCTLGEQEREHCIVRMQRKRHRPHALQALLMSQKHVTVVCAINLHSNIDEYQVNWPQHGTPITDLPKFECVCSRHFGATCLFLSQLAHTSLFWGFLGAVV